MPEVFVAMGGFVCQCYTTLLHRDGESARERKGCRFTTLSLLSCFMSQNRTTKYRGMMRERGRGTRERERGSNFKGK